MAGAHVISIGMLYFFAAVVASGIFIVAGWRSRRTLTLASARPAYALPDDPLWGETEIDLAQSQSQADVGGAIRLVLRRLAPVIARHCMHVDVASPPGLLVRMRGAMLADLLEDLLAAAIHNAPASRLLLTAARHGDRVYVGITDDIPGVDMAMRMASLRGLMERVAMRGCALDVDVRPSEGTTMTLRVAAVIDDWPEQENRRERVLPTPAAGPSAPLIPSMGSQSMGRASQLR